jgi:hypothetical protein
LHQSNERDRAALRVVIAGQQGALGAELGYIVRQLALQEFQRVNAAYPDYAQMF